MALTTSLGPESSPFARSHTSRMYSQFSEVRFSSVAFAVHHSALYLQAWGLAHLTDGVVERILLRAKHYEGDCR